MKKITFLLVLFLTACFNLPAQTNLIVGGDFDRDNWLKPGTPNLWTFDKVELKHLDGKPYQGNTGWCYIEVTPSAEGTMRNYVENDNMEPDYASMKVKDGTQLKIVFWAMSESENTIKISTPWIGANNADNGNWTSEDITLKDGKWKKYTVYTNSAAEGTVKAGLKVLFTSANGKICFDDFAVYETDGTQTAGKIVIELEDGSQENGGQGEDGGTEPVNDNLFKYGDFEQLNPKNNKPMGWYIPTSAAFDLVKKDLSEDTNGKLALRIYPSPGVTLSTNVEGNPNILAIKEGCTYNLLFYAKAQDATDKLSMRFNFYLDDEKTGNPLYVAKEISLTTDWQLYMYEFTAPYDVNSASFTISFSTDNGYIFFDDFQMFGVSDEGDDKVTPIDGVVPMGGLFYLLQDGYAVVSPEADEDGVNYNETNRPRGEIEIPAIIKVKGVTYPVTEIAASAFDGCQDVTSVIIPDAVTKIGNYAFQNCKSLESIEISSKLEEIGFYAFYQCSALRNVTLPATLQTISDRAFGECTGLETFEMRSTTPASINTGKEIFFHVDRSVVELKVPEGSEDAYANLYPWSSFKRLETGIFAVETAQAQVVLVDGQFTVKAQQPVQVAVYNLSGKLVYNTHTKQSSVKLEKGIYVMKLGNESRKIFVK